MSTQISENPPASILANLSGPIPSRAREVLVLAAWSGLLAGILEVLTKVSCAAVGRNGGLYLMSRHFFWLIPLVNLLIFLVLGWFLAGLVYFVPRFGRWLSLRWLLSLVLLPSLMTVAPEISTWAWFLLSFGICARFAGHLERNWQTVRRSVRLSLPVFAVVTLSLAGWIFGADWARLARESARPYPAAGSPNVLLIVLDTVRADRVSAYGYPRGTTPRLDLFGSQAIRFAEARSTASWTLPSHGSMFTGRLPHELGAEWLTPIDSRYPTVAEYLGSHGYATAGFVGNTFYCSYDSGLAKGFTHYKDYGLDRCNSLLVAQLARSGLTGFFHLSGWAANRLGPDVTAPLEAFVRDHVYSSDKKNAGIVNREFFGWLATRKEPDRPFFAFLNYTDAHDPYLPPKASDHRFGLQPSTRADFTALQDWVTLDKRNLHKRFRTLASDCYDDCLFYMDEQIHTVFLNLASRKLMNQTIVIVAGDHGESFGEHGLYSHGNSLYRPEIHVPLMIRVPASRPVKPVVDQVVSLRDLPATIVDLVNLREGSPFPGQSLSSTWNGSSDGADREPAISELRSPNPWSIGQQAPSPAENGPLTAISSSHYTWIRGARESRLFDASNDPLEETDLSRSAGMQPVLEQFQKTYERIFPPSGGLP